jgi:hypothetical protein
MPEHLQKLQGGAAVAAIDPQLHDQGLRVLGGVGERLGRDVVGGRFEMLPGREPSFRSSLTGTAERRARVMVRRERRLLARREAPVVPGRAGLVDNASHDEERQAWPT